MKIQMKRLLSAVLSILIALGVLLSANFGGLRVNADVNKPPYCGIDVSKHNGDVNWKTVKSRGVDFAFVRCYSLRKDETFDRNYAGAVENGIAVGSYIYMYAEDEAEAKLEAQGALDALGGKALDLPLFLDVEYYKVTRLGKKALTDLMLIELEMFRKAGYKTGIYTSLSFIDSYMDASRLTDYSWWVARWTCEQPQTFTFRSESPDSVKKPTCDVWQFSDAGKGSYFGTSSEYVDLNFCYVAFNAQSGDTEQTTTPAGSEQTTAPADPERTTAPADPERTTAPAGSEQTTTPTGSEQTTAPAGSEQTTAPDKGDQPEQSILSLFFDLFKWSLHCAAAIFSIFVASK